jgi:hypothetical protein
VVARVTGELVGSDLFSNLQGASAFFEAGSSGYSPSHSSQCFEGMELHTNAWKVDALHVDSSTSRFFDDTTRFSKGSATLDCGLIMRQVPVRWRSLPRMNRLVAISHGT